MNSKSSTQKILWIIFITIFIDMLGIGILIPVFPLLLSPTSLFKITPANWSNSQNYIMAGWLLASFPLAQFFCTPILGQLSDSYGRRKIFLISIGGTAFAYLLFAIGVISHNLPLMFAARILDGASGGNISIAQAIIGDISPAEQRTKNFGLFGVALGIGFVFGPFIGGKLSDSSLLAWFSPATPFWFAGGLSLVNIFLVAKLLPETLQQPSGESLTLTKSLQNILKVFRIKQLNNIIPVTFLFNSGFTFFTTFWGIILAEKYGFGPGGIGNFFAYMGVMIILAQGVVVRRLSGKVADYKVLHYSLFGSGVSILAYYFIPAGSPHWIYWVPPFMALSIALTKAFSLALITRVSPAAIRGEVMGISSSSNALAQAIPALLAGYVAAWQTTLAILIGGMIVLGGGLLFCLRFKNKTS